jgi:phospholipase C
VAQLSLACEGAAAVLHVYDRLQLDALPRRFTVAPGRPVTAAWPLHAGRYDLWLLGPNGFHRHFAGSAQTPRFEARVAVATDGSPRIALQLRNPGTAALDLAIRPIAYADPLVPRGLRLAALDTHTIAWPVATTGGWYDLQIGTGGGAQRLAGRVETGADSTSDPAMGGPALLWQEEIGA